MSHPQHNKSVSMKAGLLIFAIWIMSISLSWALPYHVDPQLLTNIQEKKIILTEHPTSDNAKFELAMAYAYTGQVDLGWELLKNMDKSYSNVVIQTYAPLQESDPTNWKYPFNLAFGYYFNGDVAQALSSFNHVLDIDPRNVWAMGFIALILGEQKDYKPAIEWCKKGLKIEPNATALHLLIALGYKETGNYFSAMKHGLIGARLYSKHEK